MNKIYPFIMALVIIGCQQHPETTSRVSNLPYYEEATFTPQWFSESNVVPTDFHKIPDFQLVNQSGENLTEEDFVGKIYVADFFFTSCPGICPKMTSNMSLIQEAFKDDEQIVLLSHSVTPEYDSIPILREYAENKGVIDGKWHLVTGDRDHIYDLGRNHYFVEEDLGRTRDINDFLHTENFILVDGNRHIRGIYNGLNKTAVNQLITDIRTLQQAS